LPARTRHIRFYLPAVLNLLIFIAFPVFSLHAQADQAAEGETGDTVKRARIEIISTELFEFMSTDSNQVRQFTDEVHFRHEGTDFYCRKAVQFMDTEIVIATGDVHIQKPDSFEVWADYLVYYSKSKIAKFRSNVIFRDSTAKLLTDSLDYNLDTDIGYFWSGGSLVTDSSTLTSKTGTYYHRRREAIFKGDVHLANPDFDLYSDSMRYDTEEKVAWFIAPTRIENEEDVILTNSGYYDTRTNQAVFAGNMEMESGATRIVANQLIYDKEAGYGEASGNVVWEDTAEQITILANYSEYLDSGDYVMATLDPLLIDVNEGDTLYLSADTLVTFKAPVYVLPPADTIYHTDSSAALTDTMSAIGHAIDQDTMPVPLLDSVAAANHNAIQDTVPIPANDTLPSIYYTIIQDTVLIPTGDTVRVFYAYRNTRLLNGRMAGDCDSLYFSEADSIFRLHGDPLMWVDTTQFSGDSMHMALHHGSLDKIYIYRNAMIIHENGPDIFDQTKGKLITGFFIDDDLKRMEVEGNGESIYFIQDDSSAYVGGNKSLCSRMVLYMSDSTDEVEHITFLTKPEATFTPMDMIVMAAYNLEGFTWQIALRPFTVYDVVRYLPLYQYYLRRISHKETMPAQDTGLPEEEDQLEE
jgi:lipopolysaccharide export system protein LptA